MTHFGIYAFVANKIVILALEPIGAVGYVASIAIMAIISGTSESAGPKDQGTLLGTLNGLKMLASVVGPFLLAAFNTNYKTFPAPLNWPGVGFAFLAIVMVPAFIMSGTLLVRARASRAEVHKTPSGSASSVSTDVSRGLDCQDFAGESS